MALYRNIGHWLILFSIFFLLTGCAQAKQNKEDEEILLQIKDEMTHIYSNDFNDLHPTIEQTTLTKVGKQLDTLNKKENVSEENQTLLDELTTQHDLANQMYHLELATNYLLKQNGQLKKDLLVQYEHLTDQFASFTTYYNRQIKSIDKIYQAIEKRIAQEKHIKKTEKFIASLYKNKQLKHSLTKKDYNKLEKLIKKVENEKLAKSFKTELKKIDKKLTEIAKAKAEEEKKKEEERIAAEKKRLEEERIAAEEKKKEEQIAANNKKNEESNNQQNEATEKPKEKDDHQQQDSAKDKETPPSDDGLPSEPTYVNGVIIASKKYPLPANYAPGESSQARSAFNKMAKAANADGIQLTAFSTYRSFDYQVNLYNAYVARDGQAAADRYSSKPGYSEHQTGLAFDIGDSNNTGAFFSENKATDWLAKEAYKYGFILRYPAGKESITGYMYEPWHYRFVGVDLAKKIYNQHTTLEEYFGL